MTELILAFGTVVVINIVLSGDNAVVIALASRNLPEDQKKKAIFWGSALAVILRIVLVIGATFLLRIPMLQFIGGLALIYIGFHLLTSGNDEEDISIKDSKNLGKAIQTILIADLIMSVDNVLAIAGVAKGNWAVLIFGLAVSVPIVIFCASILSKLMNRFPIIVYIGAGLIAYTAAEMMVSDVKVGHYLEPYEVVLKIGITAGVVGLGYLFQRSKTRKKAKAAAEKEGAPEKEGDT